VTHAEKRDASTRFVCVHSIKRTRTIDCIRCYIEATRMKHRLNEDEQNRLLYWIIDGIIRSSSSQKLTTRQCFDNEQWNWSYSIIETNLHVVNEHSLSIEIICWKRSKSCSGVLVLFKLSFSVDRMSILVLPDKFYFLAALLSQISLCLARFPCKISWTDYC
jgi:hypothetical protein